MSYRIGKPYHSEGKTLWYVLDEQGETVDSIAIGEERRSPEGACYKLIAAGQGQEGYGFRSVGQLPRDCVLVQRTDGLGGRGAKDERHIWNVYSFVIMRRCTISEKNSE